MGVVETILVLLVSSSVCVYLLLVAVKFLHKTWWTPIRIRQVMSSQGIEGPPYGFIHGNNKEILKMRAESLSKPMDPRSHNIYHRLLPDQESWLNIYGKIFLMWIGPRAHLVIAEPELAREILNNKENMYPKLEAEGFLKKLLGDGLVTSQGEKWGKLRKLANHAFHAERLKDMVPAMTESVEKMLEKWKDHEGKEIEVFEEFRGVTSEVISRTAFGSSYLEGKCIFEMLMKLAFITSKSFITVRLPVFSLFWKSSDEKESDKLEQGIRDAVLGIMEKREKLMTRADYFGTTDLLGILMKANKDTDENHRITVEDVIDECKTFYFAGNETTSTLLSWAVLLLALHTDWQDEARKEVRELCGLKNPNAECLAKMKKINMIINETLRLYPPVIEIGRKVQRETRLGNLVLPANVIVVVPTLAIHLNPQIWGEDADLFKPERFSGGVAKATNNNPGAFLPFSLGPRNCVGMNFAVNEAKIALAMILQRYAFTLSPAYVHAPMRILTVRPQHGIQVMLHAL